jgi:hypothetical protein
MVSFGKALNKMGRDPSRHNLQYYDSRKGHIRSKFSIESAVSRGQLLESSTLRHYYSCTLDHDYHSVEVQPEPVLPWLTFHSTSESLTLSRSTMQAT